MTIIVADPPFADVIGCPEFFVTDIFTENAGGGCIRLIGCAKRNGVLIPQYTVVMPYRSMLAGATKATEAALGVWQDEGLIGACH